MSADYVSQLAAELERAHRSADVGREWLLAIEVRRNYTPRFRLTFKRPEPSGFADVIDGYVFEWTELADAAERTPDVRTYARTVIGHIDECRRAAVAIASSKYLNARPATPRHSGPPTDHHRFRAMYETPEERAARLGETLG